MKPKIYLLLGLGLVAFGLITIVPLIWGKAEETAKDIYWPAINNIYLIVFILFAASIISAAEPKFKALFPLGVLTTCFILFVMTSNSCIQHFKGRARNARLAAAQRNQSMQNQSVSKTESRPTPSKSKSETFRQHVVIPIESYSSAQWNKYGPIERSPGVLQMRDRGYITYEYILSTPEAMEGKTIELRLTSALAGYGGSDGTKKKDVNSSDVNIFLNNILAARFNVEPDAAGTDNKVFISGLRSGELRPGKNTITFKIEGGNENGLIFHSPMKLTVY